MIAKRRLVFVIVTMHIWWRGRHEKQAKYKITQINRNEFYETRNTFQHAKSSWTQERTKVNSRKFIRLILFHVLRQNGFVVVGVGCSITIITNSNNINSPIYRWQYNSKSSKKCAHFNTNIIRLPWQYRLLAISWILISFLGVFISLFYLSVPLLMHVYITLLLHSFFFFAFLTPFISNWFHTPYRIKC